ncbi:MAG TPA: enoyl-CoA hydratase-related protein [Pseudonocardiaceae bacterium]|nr:enoyl-CoA hydratase-related protein [Pseudonocardiaceae bacterium]
MARELTVDRDGGVVAIELPGGLLTAATVQRLVAAIEDTVLDDDTVRVVVLGAAGEDFCTGLDPSATEVRPRVDPAAAVAAIPVPVLVRLTGLVASGGLEIAMAGDIRIAAPGTSCAIDDLSAGVLPCWGGTQRLPRLVGLTRATAMLFLGDRMDAEAAVRAGLLTRIADDPVAAVADTAATMAALAPIALRYAKEAVTSGTAMAMHHGMQLEADLNSFLQLTDDRDEGLTAFFERRPPSFRGC